jgi:hypothetical protein
MHTYIHAHIHTYLHIRTTKNPKKCRGKELEDESAKKWQRNWTLTLKEKTTKEYFPDVAESLKMKLVLTQNLTALVSGQGKTRDYLYRFKIIDEPTCPCGEGDQTLEHVIYECERLSKEIDRLKRTATRTNPWPISKRDLLRIQYNECIKFINEIQFD